MLHFRFFSRAAAKTFAAVAHNEGKVQIDDETFQNVRLAVQALPFKYREPVVLKYLQELSTDEITRILGISKNALQVRLSRARERLRQDLAELIG
jgi:RNA polymerase sigma factor (sigma-70 family)